MWEAKGTEIFQSWSSETKVSNAESHWSARRLVQALVAWEWLTKSTENAVHTPFSEAINVSAYWIPTESLIHQNGFLSVYSQIKIVS